jgi:cation transport regulator ChaC
MADGLTWYFAYGSNMDPVRLFDQRLAPRGVPRGARIAGRLDGWRLVFDKPARHLKGAAAANIVPAGGGVVHGTLNALPDAGFAVLDIYEGVADRHYERRTIGVMRGDTGEKVEAIVYVALMQGEGLRPQRAYLECLLAGRDLLPPDYGDQLAAMPTFD